MSLEAVAIETDCHPEERVRQMSEDIENKVTSMAGVLKSYKKLVFKAESELKKDCTTIMKVMSCGLLGVDSV